MRVIRLQASSPLCAAPVPSAVAIGNFDGLHLGHRAVIFAMQQAAEAAQLVPSVLSFVPHPRQYFGRTEGGFLLQRLPDKLRLLEALGVAQVFLVRFNATLAGWSAQQFAEQLLVQQCAAKHVVTGTNFAFGKGREGDGAVLAHFGAQRGFSTEAVAPVFWHEQVCSSSAIRRCLAEGNMAQASAMLGQYFSIEGRVMHGDKRGRTIGFPTANISLHAAQALPARGVYVVCAEAQGISYTAVANIGLRPSVGTQVHPTLEVHLLDASPELYGKKCRVSFLHKLRDEQKFDGLEALKAQITRDVEAARAYVVAL